MAWSTEEPPEIFTGAPFTEKKSKFQAFCALCKTIQDVVLFRDTLLENPKIESATHNILAYITPEESGFDDDGETHAGTQMLNVMKLAGAQDCAVIVSRWFGGIQLHGDRFRIINHQALDVLRANGFLPDKTAAAASAKSASARQKGKKRR
jgi:hypothetical protein